MIAAFDGQLLIVLSVDDENLNFAFLSPVEGFGEECMLSHFLFGPQPAIQSSTYSASGISLGSKPSHSQIFSVSVLRRTRLCFSLSFRLIFAPVEFATELDVVLIPYQNQFRQHQLSITEGEDGKA